MGIEKRKEGATGEMSIMGKSGDTKQYWNVKSWDEVEAAKMTFDLYIEKGFKAFSMDSLGEKGEPITSFDPSAGSIIFIVPMQGGLEPRYKSAPIN